MSDEALKRRLTDFICEVPFPRFVQSQGAIKIVADDLATWLAVFISYETKPLTAVAEAARALVKAVDRARATGEGGTAAVMTPFARLRDALDRAQTEEQK